MTMQIAMHGSDGILLAGDTRWSNPLKLRGPYWTDGIQGQNSTKIKIDHEQRIAISCAGNMDTSGFIANNLLAAFKTNGVADPIGTIQQVASTVQSSDQKDAKCMIALPGRRLYSVKTTQNIIQHDDIVVQWNPIMREQLSADIAGDDVSAALFWIEKYYDAINKLPIRQLIPLAAHMIGCAHQLNPRGVSGLEIVLCDSDGVNCLSRESIEDLEKKAVEWDRLIRNLVYSHKPQYTYAPNI